MDGTLPPRITIHRHDDRLGNWMVALCRPQPALHPFVSSLWYGEGQVSYRRDRILPTGDSFLLINLGAPQYLVDDGPPPTRVAFRDIWYSGLRETPIETEAPHGNRLLGVAFTPCGARPWLHLDADATAQRIHGLTDLLGDSVLQLRRVLLDCDDLTGRFAVVERWLIERLHPRYTPHPLVPWTLERLARTGGQARIDELAREAGVSRKHLANLFRRDVGLTPKAVARIHRFKGALALLSDCEQVPWVELAAHCGYYDQSHLVRDFRAFSGFAPGEFVRRGRPDAGSVVVE